MKIAYFVGELPYEKPHKGYLYGGTGIAAYQLGRVMSQKGHYVFIFTTSKYFFKNNIQTYGKLRILRYGWIFKVLNYPVSISSLYNPISIEADIAHIHIGGAPTLMLTGLMYKNLKKKPLVVTYHTEYTAHSDLRKRVGIFIVKKLVDKVLSRADIIVTSCNCDKEKSELLKKYKEKIITIPVGITLENFNISRSKDSCRNILNLPRHKNIVLYVGGLHELKGLHILIRSIQCITKLKKDVVFVFVGGGTIEKYKKISEELGINDYVIFTGFVEEHLKVLYYGSADIFVYPLTNYIGGFGIVNLEAMASSLPVIGTDVCGLNEIIRNGENGLLVPPGDHHALADAILYLLDNPEVRKKFGENGRREAQKYTWEKIAERYLRVYEELV